MSMNLHVEIKGTGEKLEIWQTPNWVTKIALNNHNGDIREWEDTLYIYCWWLKSQLNGVFKTQEEIDDHNELRERIRNHCKELESVGELEWYVL